LLVSVERVLTIGMLSSSWFSKSRFCLNVVHNPEDTKLFADDVVHREERMAEVPHPKLGQEDTNYEVYVLLL
jgi:hypothetical protein